MAKRMPASIYLFSFSIGVIVHRFLDTLIPVWVAVSILIITAISAIWSGFGRVVLALMIGLVWANWVASGLLAKSIPVEMEKQDIEVMGHIVGVPVKNHFYSRFDFEVVSLIWSGIAYSSPGRIRLKAYDHIDKFHANQSWEFTVRLKQSRSYQNPGARFNYETYLFENRIRATGYVRNENTNKLLANSTSHFSISKFREWVGLFIRENFSGHSHTGILNALIVGVRGTLKDSHWRILQNTGTIHLVAISGLHIGMVSGFVMLFIARIWRLTGQLQIKVPSLYVATMAGLIAGGCYALLAGMTIPTRRAMVMLAVVGISVLLNRKSNAFELLVLVLATVLLTDPLAPLSGGFWLSFSAVAVIVSWIHSIKRKTETFSPKNPMTIARDWTSLQLVLSFGMAPLLLLLFQKLSLIAPVANLIAIPVIGIIVVPLGLIGLGLLSLGFQDLALILFEGALICIDYLWIVLEFLGTMEWSIWQPPAAPTWMMAFAVVGLLFLFLGPTFPGRITAILWVLPLMAFQPQKLNMGTFRYTMLDVGHGLASVIETRNHVLIYDAGPNFRGGMDTGKSIVIPYLYSRGISTIDTIIISHGHNDHIGGYRSIVEEFEITRQLFGEPSTDPDVSQCRSGQRWVWDGVKFEVLWPNEIVNEGGNNASCVLKVSSLHGSILITGDIEARVERKLIAEQSIKLNSDVIQVPHQGSKTSSTRSFVWAVNPDLALLSTGYLNRFHHPHESVSRRYSEMGIDALNTAFDGSISVVFAAQRIVTVRRKLLTGYWFLK